MANRIGVTNHNVFGDFYFSMAENRVNTLRHSLGLLNHGIVLSNYGYNAHQYLVNELDHLLVSLLNERIIVWVNEVTWEYRKMCHEFGGVVVDLDRCSDIPYDKKIIVIVSPISSTDKRRCFEKLMNALTKMPFEYTAVRTYLYVESLDSLFRADQEHKDNALLEMIENIIKGSRRKKIVFTGFMALPFSQIYTHNYHRLFMHSAYLLVAGDVSSYDASEISELCGIPPRKIFNHCSVNEITMLWGRPKL